MYLYVYVYMYVYNNLVFKLIDRIESTGQSS